MSWVVDSDEGEDDEKIEKILLNGRWHWVLGSVLERRILIRFSLFVYFPNLSV